MDAPAQYRDVTAVPVGRSPTTRAAGSQGQTQPTNRRREAGSSPASRALRGSTALKVGDETAHVLAGSGGQLNVETTVRGWFYLCSKGTLMHGHRAVEKGGQCDAGPSGFRGAEHTIAL